MKKVFRSALVVVFLGLGFLAYQKLFPGDETRIRRELSDLARCASMPAGEPVWRRVANANRLAEFFSADVALNLEPIGLDWASVNGRAELRPLLLAARSRLQQSRIEFPEMLVAVAPDRTNATAIVGVVAEINGEPNAVVQELKMSWRKIDGQWRIATIEAVRALK